MDVLTVLTALAEAKGGQVSAWNNAQGVSVADYDTLIESVNANERGECDKALAALSALGEDSMPDVAKTKLLDAIRNNKSTVDGISELYPEALKDSSVVYLGAMKCRGDLRDAMKNCALLTFVESIDGENVAWANDVMNDCSSLVAVGEINLPKVINMARAFAYCYSLKKVKFTEGSLTLLTSADSMFGACYSLPSVEFPAGSLKALNVMRSMFSSDSALTSVSFPEGSLAEVTNASYAFNDCSALTSLTFPEGGLAKLENGENMFSGCVELASLKIQAESMSNLSNIASMFYGCKKLPEDPLKDIDMSGVMKMRNAYMNCSSMTSFNHPETTNAASFNCAFTQCAKLESATLGASAWRELPTTVTSMNKIFESCPALTNVTFQGGTSKMFDACNAFYACNALKIVEGLDLSGLCLTKSEIAAASILTETLVEQIFSRITASTFYNCKALEECELSGTLYKSGMNLRPCASLSARSLYTWVAALYDWTTNAEDKTTDDADHVLYMTAAQQETLLTYSGDSGESGETAFASSVERGWTISE